MDATRIVLKQNVPPETDYINANMIQIDGINKQFIATQGPMENTAADFWRMVFQAGEQAAPAIVMLGQCVEEGYSKCFQYWPIVQGAFKNYGCMLVTNKNVEVLDRFIIYRLEVLPDGCSNSVLATLYFYPDWPTRGLPKSPMGVLRLLKHLRQNKLVPGPWIVHSSSGLSRTGTLIAIEVGMQMLIKNEHPRVKHIVRKIREQRPHSVRNTAQYVLIFACLLYYCHAKGKNCKVIAQFHASFCAAVGSKKL